MAAITLKVILHAVVLKEITEVVFGWLFLEKGLESTNIVQLSAVFKWENFPALVKQEKLGYWQ